MPGSDDVAAAAHRIGRLVRRTPILRVDVPGVAVPVVLKLEYLQHTGSFKVRGAFNKLLSSEIGPAGVTAASGGNHGIGVAHAAAQLGVPCRIFVPLSAPDAKVAAIIARGAEVERVGRSYAEAAEASAVFAAESGALDVPAYDDPAVVAGQGTLARELVEQAPGVSTVIAAVGGGGLIGGIAAWYGDSVALIGVEPERSRAMDAALETGAPIDVETGGIAADSLGSRRVGVLPFALARATGIRTVLVTDGQIRAAQHWLWDQARILSEPGGATALAALLSGSLPVPDAEEVAVIVCGANVDPARVFDPLPADR